MNLYTGYEVTAASDNVFMARLANACTQAAESKEVGDSIDRGLILLRLLNEQGFSVHLKSSAHRPGTTIPIG